MQSLMNIGLIAFIFTCNLAPAQSPDKLYTRGIESFYKEDFEAAITHFELLHSGGKYYKDSEYRLEIAYLVLPKHRERTLEKMLKFEEFKSKNDKFYYYWMGRIYANRYMFPEAVDAWEKFLNRKAYKSEEIVAETKKYLDRAKNLVKFFDNPDNYEIHQLEAPINTEFAETTPVYSEAKDELLFASNRSNPSKDVFKIYHSEGNDTGWSPPSQLDILGTFDRDQANVEVVNEDGKLFIYKNVKKGDLFYSEPEENGWKTPVEFDSKITSTHMESHFYINEHEDRIIFSTKNKKAGLDLMESFRDPSSGKWSDPKPFSLTINSEYNEDSPFLSSDEKHFYFLSDRPGGVGGYDVYHSVFDSESNSWTSPINMGWPINSPDDEIHFKVNSDMNSGYFSSNRIHSKGDYDIFFFWKIEKTKIKGRVINALTQEPLNSGEIRFHPSQYIDEYFRSPLDSTGRYSMDIISDETFRVEVTHYTDTLMVENFEIHDAKGESITHYKDFYVIPANISDEQRKELESKYRNQPEIQLQKPAIIVDPVVIQNTKVPDDSNMNTLKQQKNIEKTSTSNTTSDPVPPVRKTNSYATSKVVNNEGARIFVGNIYFEFGTSKLTDSSLPRLNEILGYLQNHPTAEIIIKGHTDNIGTEKVNQIISQKRAETAKDWLVQNGIASERMSTVGYGSSQPLASNDDEINGRSLNRRIEIRLKN